MTNPESNYVRLLLAHYLNGGIRRGEVNVVEVLHDDWCSIFNGGACDCDPIVVSSPAVDRKYGLGDSDPREAA
jgi:hypothetical protein